MIRFTLNGQERTYEGEENLKLLTYLREIEGITSVKDGCSGQATCGACMVEMNGKALLSCATPMKKAQGAQILTIEGFDKDIKETLARAFAQAGAVQCGFCSPGFLTRAKILLQDNPDPSEKEIREAFKFNLCRCTGFIKIIEAVQSAASALREKRTIKLPLRGKIGQRLAKYQAVEKALGQNPFVDDLKFPNMVYGALKFSDHPRARILKIDVKAAEALDGVLRVFTARDIPGERYNGLIVQDWPVMVGQGEIIRYVGDVLAGVVAESEQKARQAASLIDVEYEILEPVTDMLAAETSAIKVHEAGNLLDRCAFKRGEDTDQLLDRSDFTVEGTFLTQRVEHAYLETEAAVALPWNQNGIELYVQSQGVYEDRIQLSRILALPEERIKVNLVPNGGGFGGKEDMSVQPHAALYCYHLKRPVKVRLNREESIRMHPKRHPVHLVYRVGCDRDGKLTALKARIVGDTGAYASVGMKVLERTAGHATGAYHFPSVDIEAKTVYTNNVPCGAMRGFGVNQAAFALESCVDELCEKGGFDRWQFRYDNALTEGSLTATGQILKGGVGVRATLLAVKEPFYKAKCAGLACGIKNTGIGNGMVDEAEAKIEIRDEKRVVVHHGWTEMGQGLFTVAQQFLSEETGIEPDKIEVLVSTAYNARAGMTTASRGTSLLGNAIIEAARELKKDLEKQPLRELVGRIYYGKWSCNWTTKPGAPGEVVTHYSYGYATQLVVLDEQGKVEEVFAAHDAGKIINPTLFEGQIQGAVHMGLGYALSEELPMEGGYLKTTKLRDLGILRIKDMPKVTVIGVEVGDPQGPHGAKGVGEIGLVPTAGAVANALYQYDKQRRYRLPLEGQA